MKQEQASLDRINDSFKKVIVVQDNIASWHNEKSYLTINILDFLLNPIVQNYDLITYSLNENN